jgi:hypothetical protein
MRPKLGFKPKQPLMEAGRRTDPPPSLAVTRETTPPAIAAAEPPLEPPGVRSRFQGLRDAPNSRFFVIAV